MASAAWIISPRSGWRRQFITFTSHYLFSSHCFPGPHQLEVQQLRAGPLSGGVSYCAAGIASGALLSLCFLVMLSCTSPSSSSSPTCSCWTFAHHHPLALEPQRSCSTFGSSPWCWKNLDRWESKHPVTHLINYCRISCFGTCHKGSNHYWLTFLWRI